MQLGLQKPDTMKTLDTQRQLVRPLPGATKTSQPRSEAYVSNFRASENLTHLKLSAGKASRTPLKLPAIFHSRTWIKQCFCRKDDPGTGVHENGSPNCGKDSNRLVDRVLNRTTRI